MTLALNIILDAIIVAVIVGMLASAIWTSRPERPAPGGVRRPRRAPTRTPATWAVGAGRSRSWGSS